MDASLAEAVTQCPACRRDVLLSKSTCPDCGAAANTSSAFLNFRRPDGSGGIIDQQTVSFLRSPLSEPSQSDLDQLIPKISRVQITELVFEDKVSKYRPVFDLTRAEDLATFWKYAAIKPSSFHLLTFGELCVDFYANDERVARIEIVANALLRWPERWKTDAQLIDPLGLADFLRDQGFGSLRQKIDQDLERANEMRVQQAAWIATWLPAIPPGLAPLVEELSNEEHATQPKALPRALEILSTRYESRDEQILALLAWYGHGHGKWHSYPSSEAAPEVMLQTFSPEEVLQALRNKDLSTQHLEGIARFSSRWVPKDRKKGRQQLIDQLRQSPILDQIHAHVNSCGDDYKVEAVRHAFE